MAEYIEREKVLKFIQDGLNYPDRTSAKAFGHDGVEIMSEVYHMPAANVAPVVLGQWEMDGIAVRCNKCHGSFVIEQSSDNFDLNFCPHCGAKMDGGQDNEL